MEEEESGEKVKKLIGFNHLGFRVFLLEFFVDIIFISEQPTKLGGSGTTSQRLQDTKENPSLCSFYHTLYLGPAHNYHYIQTPLQCFLSSSTYEVPIN